MTAWVARGLLPEPTTVSQGYPLGSFNRYPASVLSRARFIASKRLEGMKLDAILELFKAEDARARAGRVQHPDRRARDGRRADRRGAPARLAEEVVRE